MGREGRKEIKRRVRAATPAKERDDSQRLNEGGPQEKGLTNSGREIRKIRGIETNLRVVEGERGGGGQGRM